MIIKIALELFEFLIEVFSCENLFLDSVKRV